jgi:hypothetical protein
MDEEKDRLPAFVVELKDQSPRLSLKFFGSREVEHLPGCVDFEGNVEPVPEPKWFHKNNLYLCLHGKGHSEKTMVSAQGDIVENVRDGVEGVGWSPISAELILDNVLMDKRAYAKIQELAGVEPDKPSGLPEITEGSVWHFDGWDHIVRRVPSGGPWVASPKGLPYCEVAPVCEDINDVFGDFRDEVKFVRQEPVKEESSGSASDSGCDIAPGEWVKWDGDLCCITKALPSGRFSLVAERTSTKWEAVCSEIEKLPKIGEWQDGPGQGNDYQLPVGTEFEIAAGLPKTTGRVVAEKPNDSCSNATWADEGTRNEPWVRDFANHRFRVTKYPSCPVVGKNSEPAPAFEVGDWVRSADEGDRLMKVTEVISAEQVRVQFIDLGSYYSGVRNLRKVTFRPFASVEEFKPHRDRWVQCKEHGAIGRVVSYGTEGIRASQGASWSYEEMLDKATFEDGTPCGVEVAG